MSELDNFLNDAPPDHSSFQVLENRLEHIWQIARDFGMDPFPTHFDVVPPLKMHEIASYGLPQRFSHWTYGRSYRETKTRHDYGLGRLYEVVINANPSQAYLLENNSDIENTMVMAHVLGHTDFFKNNRLFQKTRKDMPQAASNYADRIRQLQFEHGALEVEKHLDACLSIAEHVDPHNLLRLPKEDQILAWQQEFKDRLKPTKPKTEFDDLFVEDIQAERKRREEASKQRMKIPLHPDKDLLGFIADYAHYLEPWQREVLQIVRQESLYFVPQRKTKIMNEGYASYFHKRFMRQMSDQALLSQEDEFRWTSLHASIVSPGSKSLNPYHFGMNMFDFIEDYYNGQLTDKEKRLLEKAEMPIYPEYKGEYLGSPGQLKVRETMMLDDDQSFIRNHFCQVPAERMDIYIYKEREVHGPMGMPFTQTVVVEKGWEIIRDNMIASLNNCGDPYLTIDDADYNLKGELYIKHAYEGQELDSKYLEKTLPYIHRLWGRAVNLDTVVQDKPVLFTYSDNELTSKTLGT